MKTTVRTHKIPGYGPTLRTATRLTEQAVPVVNRAVAGTMPDVEVILTNERGMAELMAAADVALAGALDRRTLANAERAARKVARDIQANAIPRLDGSALLLIDVDKHPTPAEFALTIIHELVHAMQFSRKGVLERCVANARDRFRIERMSRRQAREHDRLLDQEEAEAYGHEYLANRIVPGAHP
ncbi:hypothetical protein [Streptomyces sp. YS415]|uniref:hypothetical protein n=1 Tax=Streptomyces sp. YS415 TaxID=2944806 RepID=UPI002021CE5F|nr:hypothetical protein [Streptomyces sp. YS415]MCL7424244.1 hypothetical protein [Streptomyces sp. YS415]